MSLYLAYADYPTEEDWERIFEKKEEAFKKIRLKEPGTQKYSLLNNSGLPGIKENDLSFWLNEYNWKVYDLSNTYVMMMHYYNKGIPDSEWFRHEDNGFTRLFPNFEEKHDALLYWFGFYMDAYYSKFSTLVDTLTHIINIQYDLGVESTSGFRGKVAIELKHKDRALLKALNKFRKDESCKKADRFRNDLTHNYKPNNVSSGITQEKKEGMIVITGKAVGDYTTTTEFVENIESIIEVLANLIDTIRAKIEPTY